jgi:hypothetical protein
MEAPSISKAASPTSSSSGGKGGFYLQPRTKVGILSVCLTLIFAASGYSVLQSLNPDPLDTSFSGRLWYPYETNPYARLQGVRCDNKDKKDKKYACRLNGVAVNGTGDLPEVWAVGNVGLVLHRTAGQKKWEQLTITAKEKRGSILATPRPLIATTDAPHPAPPATPTRGIAVPNLLGQREDIAHKIAASGGFQLEVEYEGGRAPSAAQQGPPPDYRVVKQSPEPKTLAPPKSTIKVTMGKSQTGAGLLDLFVTPVYAAEPEGRPRSAPSAQGNVSQGPFSPSLMVAGPGQGQPQLNSATLDDDLIYIACAASKRCRALGRSGRIYSIDGSNEWGFEQATFMTSDGSSTESLVLKNAYGFGVLAQVGVLAQTATTKFDCMTSLSVPIQVCRPASAKIIAQDTDLVLKASQLPSGRIIFDFDQLNVTNDTAESLLVGNAGFIAKVPSNQDLRAPIQPARSDTKAALRWFSFDSSDTNSNGFVVGDEGIILSSSDAGKTWRHETQGPEGAAANYRLPAFWYWLVSVLLIGICSAAVAMPAPPPPTEFSVADWTVTDAPLKPGDVDSLGFTPMALGLSRFIRNPKTQPPVTIAIEGEWGEGKSSVMALLRGDLEKSRFRPVWFNAWHHQSEEQLLAALLEHIKDQAVPPWWHIDNWIFRARLVYIRFRGKWPLVILLALALCGSVTFELGRHDLKWEHFVEFGQQVVALIRYVLPPWSGQTPPPAHWGHFGLAGTLIAVFATIFKKAQAFGINTAKLTDNLRDAATIKDIKPDPGVRPRFAREFGDVCTAWSWGGRRVIIFIDDLDRCRPESVVTVLESINFLTTAGDCMMVLGMAQDQVTHCVGLGFKDIAHAEAAYQGGGNTEQEKAVARFNYGAFYIKKLVNIVAPLPKTTPEQRRRVLEARAAEVRRQAEEQEQQASRASRWRGAFWDWASQAGSLTLKAAPVVAMLLAVGLTVRLGYNQGHQQRAATEQNQDEGRSHSSDASTGSEQKTSPEQPKTDQAPVAKALILDRPTSQPATLVEPDPSAGGPWWSFVTDTFFLLIVFGILAYQLSTRTNQDAQNSPEFEESLKLWGQYIVGVCDTPREIKRALNDLRYQAMIQRTNGPSTTRGERLIRAMRQFVTGRAEKIPTEGRVDEAALPPHKAADLAALSDEELRTFLDADKVDLKGSENLRRLIELKREHLRHFHRWIGEAKPVAEPTGVAAQNPPPAQAAHQA